MFTTRVTSVGALLLAFAAGAGASLLAVPRSAAALQEDKKPAAKVEERLRPLLTARHDAAKEELQARKNEFDAGRGTLDIVFGAARRVLHAERELSDKKEDQVAALQAYLDVMKEIEEINKGRFDAGRIPLQDFKQAEYYRLDAEIMLERAKAK
jgi:outer membrane protein TolC